MTILSILVPALQNRSYYKILKELNKQSKGLPVEVLCYADNGELTSGKKRNILTQSANGKYVAFVDDDDRVCKNYVASIINGCFSDADVITFDIIKRTPRKLDERQTFRVGIQDNLYINNYSGMTANHLCAWKTRVARLVEWPNDLGYGDDQVWYKTIHLLKNWSEFHIDEVLYIYQWHPTTTVNQTRDNVKKAKYRYRNGVFIYKNKNGKFAFNRREISNKIFVGKVMIL